MQIEKQTQKKEKEKTKREKKCLTFSSTTFHKHTVEVDQQENKNMRENQDKGGKKTPQSTITT